MSLTRQADLPLILAGTNPVALRLGYAPEVPDPCSGLFQQMIEFFGRWRWCNERITDAGPCLIMWNYNTTKGLDEVITSVTTEGILVHTVRDPAVFIRRMRRFGPISLQLVDIDDKQRVICTNHRDQKAFDDGDAIVGELPRPLRAVRDFHASVVRLREAAENDDPTRVMATVHGRDIAEEKCKEAGCDLSIPGEIISHAEDNPLKQDILECSTCGILYTDTALVQIPGGEEQC